MCWNCHSSFNGNVSEREVGSNWKGSASHCEYNFEVLNFHYIRRHCQLLKYAVKFLSRASNFATVIIFKVFSKCATLGICVYELISGNIIHIFHIQTVKTVKCAKLLALPLYTKKKQVDSQIIAPYGPPFQTFSCS